jgi:hypothetical protein
MKRLYWAVLSARTVVQEKLESTVKCPGRTVLLNVVFVKALVD